MLEASIKVGAKLNINKSRIGYYTLDCLGKDISKDGTVPNKDKIQAILDTRYPGSVTEIRSFLGALGFMRHHFSDYASRTAILTNLTHQDKARHPFYLKQEEKKVVDLLKRMATQAPILAPFDPDIPLALRSDASDEAAGGCLRLGLEEAAKVILYYSHKWTDTQRKWPVYVREAYAIILGVKKSRYYIDSSKHQLTIFTDQRACMWLQHAKSPIVVGWVVGHLQHINFRVLYIKGKLNVLADAITRPPMISPGVPNDRGETFAVFEILKNIKIPDSFTKIWIAVHGIASQIKLEVKRPHRQIIEAKPTSKTLTSQWDLGIVIPDAEKAPKVAADLISLGKPFAVLLPTDLVHVIYFHYGIHIQKVRELKKMVFLHDNLVWLTHKLGMEHHEVMALEAKEGHGDLNFPKRITREQIKCSKSPHPKIPTG